MTAQHAAGLVVAVTGHRPHRLQQAQTERLAAQARQLFDDLAALAPGIAVRSALAEGADRRLAELALERGCTLQALLPFPREAYRADFGTAASLHEFEHLLGRAADCIELPGRRGAAVAAYHALVPALLDGADLLCAVWDGAPAQGPGGTAEVVAEARRRGLPVVHLSTRSDAPAALLAPDGPPGGQPCGRHELQAVLARRRAR